MSKLLSGVTFVKFLGGVQFAAGIIMRFLASRNWL